MKINTLFLSALFISISVFAMDPSIKDQAKKVVQQMLECTRPIYEKKALQMLSHERFAEHSSYESPEARSFFMLVELCDERYAPLLEALLQSKKASANTSLTLATGTRFTLLTEAIAKSEKNISSCHNRYLAVEVLLKYGADVNQESITLEEKSYCSINPEKQISLFINTPLHRAIWYLNKDLMELLLSNNAQPDKCSQKFTPLMHVMQYWNPGSIFEVKMKAYLMLKDLLDKKADVNAPSGLPREENRITTPMQYAKDKNLPEIVALFEQYQRGKK